MKNEKLSMKKTQEIIVKNNDGFVNEKRNVECRGNEKASNNRKKISNEIRLFRQFLFLFSGQQISLLGSSIVSFAIIWWLTVTTQSELVLGIASMVTLGPFILAAPISGLLADRLNRKMLLLITDAFQALITVVLAILFLTNHITVVVIFIILFLKGTAQAFHSPVSYSLVPTMVPQKQLSRINGLSYLFSGAINIIGPVIGATLLAIPNITIGMILWIDVITFGIALIPLLIVNIPAVAKVETKEKKQSFIMQFFDGINALKATKGMIALLFGAMIINFFMSPLMALLPLFVNKIHGGTEINYAIVIGMLQAAIVVGGLFMSFFKGFKKPILFFIFSVIFQQICQIVITFIPVNFNGRFWVIGSILFCFALPFSVLDVTFITTIQLLIPKEKLGRVIATIMAISPAIRPLGQFLSGVIAEFVGINIVLIVSSVLGAISIIVMYLCTSLKQLDAEIRRVMTKDNGRKEIKLEEKIGVEDGELNKKISSEIGITTASSSYKHIEKSINVQK